MTSRERVLTALHHEEPDRVPIDFGGTRVTGIMAAAYKNLRDYFGISGSAIKMYDMMQQLALPEPEMIERVCGDVVQIIRLKPFGSYSIKEWKRSRLPDGTPCEIPKDFNPVEIADGTLELIEDGVVVARKPKSALYFEMSHWPLQNAKNTDDIDSFDYPVISDEELAFVKEQAVHWRGHSDYAVMGTYGTALYEAGAQKVFGFQTFMEKLVLERELIEYWLDRQTQATILFLEKYLDAVGDNIDILQINEDLGSQNGLQISPAMFREIFKPRFAELFASIRKKNKNLFIFLHSCGSIRDIIPDLIEIGVDILNPIQTSAKGMDPAELKKEFGSRLTFWGGGVDTQTELPFGTAGGIKKQVHERLRILAPGGGYVFNQIHNIQADVPAENIAAMFEAAKEFGVYPIQ